MTDTTTPQRQVSKELSPAIEKLHDLAKAPFDRVPHTLRRKVYGVPYVQLDDSTAGQIWVTRHGWRHLEQLDPSKWYLHGQYSRRGKRLSGGSGSVYRVPTTDSNCRSIDLVVKFSRMAQQLPVHVSSHFPGDVPRHVVDSAVFNDPFQEFGVLEELRNSRFGPANLRVLTKRPLAIYSPGQTFKPWQLGRVEDRFRQHRRQLDLDQASSDCDLEPVQLSVERQYVYLFHWVKGNNAQSLVRDGVLATPEAASLVVNVIEDLAAKGFRVLDTKPNHVILRRRRDGSLVQREDRLVYALVDFELLQRTEEYETWLKRG